MKKRAAKRALLMSALSLLLCVSMLVGTTFAWFTDSVTSANNIIMSGNLDVELYYMAEDDSDWTKVTATTNIFMENALWEPGHTEVVKLKIVNEGSLALKYTLGVNIASETGSKNVAGEDFKLSEYIKFGIVNGAQTYTREQAIAAVDASATNLQTAYDSNVTELLPKVDNTTAEDVYTDIVTMVVYMPTTVDNKANHAKDADQPTINLGINLSATQFTYEEDSFDKDYDKESQVLNMSAPFIIPEQDVQQPVPIEAKGMTVEVPAEVINGLPDEITIMTLVYSDPVVGNNSVFFASVEFVDQNGKTINMENNTTPMAVTLPVQAAFAPGTVIDVFHDGVKVDTTAVAADGSITYFATHFCAVSVTTPDDAYYVSNYEEFYTEVYYGGKVIPTNDITLTDFLVSPNATDIYLNGMNLTGQTDFLFYAPIESSKLSINGVGTVTTTNGYVSLATKGGELTVNGGTFHMGNTTNKGHFFTQNSGKTIINGGTFLSSDADSPIVYCINGFVEINGGFFQNTANSKQALLSMGNNLNYVNNQKITLRGGTFVNWNPMDSAFARPWTNPDVPALIVLADGYEVVSETQANGDVWYTVVPVQ